ncbi:MAG: TetR/AcrR family transcriptional regulator [Gemmobacter sp.]
MKGVFAAKGFDGASMQDLSRAAGMSAGNFYRYFPSKGAIIEAMVMHDLAGAEADFSRIMQSGAPRAALREAIWRRMTEDCGKDGPLWSEIEAAAARRPEIAAIHSKVNAEIHLYLVRVFARIAGVTEAAAEARFGTEAELLMLLIRGAMMEGCGHVAGSRAGPADELRRAVMRHVDLVLARVAGDATFPLNPIE